MSKPKIEKKRKPMLKAIFGILANPRPKIPSSTIEMRTRSGNRFQKTYSPSKKRKIDMRAVFLTKIIEIR